MRKKYAALVALLASAILMVSCSKENDENVTSATGNLSVDNTTVETTTFEQDETETQPFDINKHVLDKNNGLYSLSDMISMEGLVISGVYDKENLIFVNETEKGGDAHRSISLLNLETGEYRSVYDGVFTEYDKDYYSYSIYKYNIISYNPFIFQNTNADIGYVFSRDFSSYSTFSVKGYTDVCYSEYNEALYYVDPEYETVKKYSISDYLNAKNTVMNIGELTSLGETVWTPDVDTTGCILAGCSANGREMTIAASSLVNEGSGFSMKLDLVNNVISEYFLDENYCDWISYDGSASLRSLYEDNKSGYEYSDYNSGKKYTFFFDLYQYYPQYAPNEPTTDDSLTGIGDDMDQGFDEFGDTGMGGQDVPYMTINKGGAGLDDKFVLQVIKPGGEEYMDIILWDYTKSVCSDITETLTYGEFQPFVEIDYQDLTQMAEVIEQKYGVEIIMGENVKNQFTGYNGAVCTDRDCIINAIEGIDEILASYPEGFLEEMRENWSGRLHFYLAGSLVSKESGGVQNAAGLANEMSGVEMVTLDITEMYNIKTTIMHEMTHIVDNCIRAKFDGNEYDRLWSANNPEGFTYMDSYDDYVNDIDYTYEKFFDDGEVDNIYFIDSYSKTWILEDRAETMSCMFDFAYVFEPYNSIHIKKKIETYLKYLSEHFETFKNYEDTTFGRVYERLMTEGYVIG